MPNARGNAKAATSIMLSIIMEASKFLSDLPRIAFIQPLSVMTVTDLAE